MIIKVDKNYNVLYTECGEYNKIENNNITYLCKINIVGKVDCDLRLHKFDNNDFIKMAEKTELSEEYISKLVGSYGIVSIKNGVFQYASTDLSAIERIYKYECENNIYYFSDVYEFILKQHINDIRLDLKSYEYYLSHGYNRGENTYIDGLKKLSPGLIYYGNGKRVDLLDIFKVNIECNYQSYKELILQEIDLLCKDKKTYIMHSGGVDSNLLLCVAQALGKKIELVTYEYCEPNQMDTNLADVERSRKIANKRNIKHNIIKMKFDNYEEYLNKTGLFYIMPFEAHKTSGAVYNLFNTLNKTENPLDYMVMCGQNNDSLYNLGPTELFTLNFFKIKNFKRGLQGVCQRLLISDIYVKSICKNKKITKKIIDNFVKCIFYLRYKKKYIPAQNCSELINYFLNSACYFAMKEENDNYLMIDYKNVNADNYRKILFKEKLRSFVDGNDNKIITSCAELNGSQVCLPYSLQPMIYFYYNMQTCNRDIFHPKDMCYKLVKEYGMNIKDFSSKYNEKIDKGMQWDNKLKKQFSTNNDKLNFQQVIGKAWSKKLINKIK